jgi:hypothetical protein
MIKITIMNTVLFFRTIFLIIIGNPTALPEDIY